VTSIPQESGVYQIRCLRNGKVYIGSALNLARRQREHWNALRAGKHANERLQHAWDRYGPEQFTFTVLELVGSDRLIDVEQAWINRTQSGRDGFNIHMVARSALGIKRRPETRAAISDARSQEWPGFVDPNGNPITIVNLWAFCKEHGLSFGAMHALATGSGRLRSYKGWTHVNSPFVMSAYRRQARGRIGPYEQGGLFDDDAA
jgi:group I intron endonuclease